MADNCNPKYKNLNRIQSFSEQRYATVQLMQQACMNEEYLRQEVETLTYLSPPAVRKTWSPVHVDAEQSWGYQVNNDNTVSFNSSLHEDVFVDFTDLSFIDSENTTCEIYVSPDGETRYAQIPQNTEEVLNKNVSDWDARAGTNEFWYVGYDKSKTYQVIPEWVDNVWDKKIPSVCRAQTFKVTGLTDDQGNNATGVLDTVVLRVQYGGSVASNVGSPLYVQIRKTVPRSLEKYKMDGQFSNKEFKFESYNPPQYETVLVPDSDPNAALATGVYYPNETTPGNISITFDHPATVENNQTYAVVFASPLSHYDHAPRVGGWGRKCDPDPYPNGHAFYSENNGYTWKKYGKDDYNVNYRYGRRWTRDFAFECHIKEHIPRFPTNEYYELYLKPIQTNPIKSVQLSSLYDKKNQDIIFEVSNTGHPDDWTDITVSRLATFSPDENGNYSNMLFVRARLKTTASNISPYINNIRLGITTTLGDEMYVRTHYYYPKTGAMLGANLWGRLYAPFTTEPSTDCTVEIINDRKDSESFSIINVLNLPDYTWIDGINEEKVVGKNYNQLVQYLTDNPDIVELLAENDILVIGFIEGIKLNNSPAYPLQGVYLQPDTNIQPIKFGEWYDFTFDYTDDILTFHNSVLSDKVIQGTLRIEYNPLFVDGLSAAEVGRRVDSETGLVEEGLILDYFKENFIITEENIETRRVELKVKPVDPIRSVILNKDSDDEVILNENIDYTVDADNKLIIFEIVGTDGVSSRLQLGDRLEVVYTPNLEDTGISIGYHAHRNDLKKDVFIEPNYLEYKV